MTLLPKTLTTTFLVLATTAGTMQGTAAQPSAPKNRLSPTAAGAARWGPCPFKLQIPPVDPRQQCATVKVPLDYRNPGGRQITVTMSRIRTAKPEQRRGVLVMNPGGPGASGLNLPSRFAQLLPADVQARYDLVGFDPRGIGHSTPVSCGLKDTELDATKISAYPAPNGDISGNVAFAKKIAAACDRASGPTLRYVTTANTARDIDRIRAALGEPKISYLGYSYGTYLGTVYASLFPERTDRIVLDSAIDPTRVWREMVKSAGPSIALRAPDFFAWAAKQNLLLHFGRTQRQVRGLYFELAGRLDRKPLKLPNGTIIDGNLFRGATFSVLYKDDLFPVGAILWKTLKTATDSSNPAVIREAARLLITALTQLGGGAATVSLPTLWGITCNDATWPLTAKQHAREVLIDRRQYPLSNGMPANIWPCAYWPYKPAEPPVPVTDRGPANILISQALRDPATPYVGAQNLRRILGNRARMVAVDAGGHGVYTRMGSTCADNTVTRFLVTGRLPRADVRCPAGDSAKALGRLTEQQRQALDELRKLMFPF